MASSLHTQEYPDKRVLRRLSTLPRGESNILYHPEYQSGQQALHNEHYNNTSSLPESFKGTRMAWYGWAKKMFKESQTFNEEVMRKVVVEQKNTMDYECQMKKGERVARFVWTTENQIQHMQAKVSETKEQIEQEVYYEEHSDEEPPL